MGAHIVDTLRESRVEVSEDLVHDPLGALLVGKVEGGRVDKGEGEGVELLEVVVDRDGLVDVEGHGPDVGGEAGTALHETGDCRELVVGGGGGHDAGVEEKAEEGGLACSPASDHESIAGGGLATGPVWEVLAVAGEV